jgi:DNA-binding HxlR family transcriptional regulator
MRHKSFGNMTCPIARSLERVGEWWSVLIMRDALHGLTRFDEFQNSLGIAPNMLSRRLTALVEAGLLERRRYSERPPRYEYVPSARGRDFQPVLVMLLAWGNKHFAPEGISVQVIDSKTGIAAHPIIVDRSTGRPITEPEFAFAAGPAATERTQQRYAVTRGVSESEEPHLARVKASREARRRTGK